MHLSKKIIVSAWVAIIVAMLQMVASLFVGNLHVEFLGIRGLRLIIFVLAIVEVVSAGAAAIWYCDLQVYANGVKADKAMIASDRLKIKDLLEYASASDKHKINEYLRNRNHGTSKDSYQMFLKLSKDINHRQADQIQQKHKYHI